MNTTSVASLVEQSSTEPGNGTIETFPLSTETETLLELLTELFAENWMSIQFGILIQGSVLEISLPHAPTLVRLLDGYLTITFGNTLHFHLCIGTNRGPRQQPTSEALQKHRKVSRAELYRYLNNKSQPVSWGLRLFNGEEEHMLTVYLPNPLLTDEGRKATIPDWEKLKLWQHLRAKYLGLEPVDSKDYLAKKFVHCCC
jgi:hypothetical protein